MEAIFCQVSSKRDKEKPSLTSENQKWKGPAPILTNIEEFTIRSFSGKDWVVEFLISKMMNIRSMVDTKAWVTKYLKEALG